MSYKWLKWLILWIPTVAIGLWEYLRHALLLPFISMDLGNVLAPVFVFVITLTLLRALFAKLESMQESLQRERVVKAAFEEREQLARELHDGISQSLFMLSVKLDKLERAKTVDDMQQTTEQMRKTVRHVYDDVRQSIANLQELPIPADLSWMQSIHHFTAEMEQSCGIRTKVEWHLQEGVLSHKQKVELLAIMREALMNVQKHAKAEQIVIRCESGQEWDAQPAVFCCSIADDGVGAPAEKLYEKGKYGVKMMQERADAMGWSLSVQKTDPHGTTILISGGSNKK
ncbi:two-component system nitrate/nitrite sensor histidine kinase NarQ [Paenibacillus endophyticus]|uniref:histidine kinase n=1 Tax=Paenibacillus endophyticus TaxID=1294268 RepID=A0A7W5GBD1_9BACL|nr:histidine kinase [Paenibacillus endophyticus]MBB3154239.1 two-component system nitrate/nitrite sensor histidine kinase NarQ [Paenibacillus endophyticus]